QGRPRIASHMASVQRMTTVLIIRGLRSSASDLLHVHAIILLFQRTLRKVCFRTTLRMATLPPTYPLAKGLKAACGFCAKRDFDRQKRHPSPPHKLQNEIRINPKTMEKITPVRHFPKWSQDVEVSIATGWKDAIEEEEQANECQRVYSDGSAVDGGVGGAAVLMRGKQMIREKKFYLGTETQHTVYEAEIIGMILAVQLLREEGRKGTMSLGVDNQAAIIAVGTFHSQPGHYLVDKFHNDLQEFLLDNDSRKLVI
ncbi:hypothetical protein BDR03DRAFT_812345, partial [Suillus americanus]